MSILPEVERKGELKSTPISFPSDCQFSFQPVKWLFSDFIFGWARIWQCWDSLSSLLNDFIFQPVKWFLFYNDVRRGGRVEEDRGEQYERVDSDNDEDEDEVDDVNARGLGDEGDDCNVRDSEDRDDIPSIHGSTSSSLHNEQRVQKQGFDTHKDPITKKKELRLYGTTK